MPDAEPDSSSQSCPACGLLIDVSQEEPLARVTCPGCGEKFRVERAFDNFALLETLGVGGKLYGGKRAGDYPRQMLHAWKLAFRHPRSGEEMSFEAPVPADFAAAMPR